MSETITVEVETGFAALGLDPRLVKTLTILGYEEPTPIQRESIPPLLEGRDLLGQAATGTGKTAAFALPLLQTLSSHTYRNGPAALVLVPTRELAMQVAEAMQRYGQSLKVRVLPIFGGQSFERQVRGLKQGADIVVATPGRALDHVRRGTLKLGGVSAVVLDEADEMLDLGFTEDLEALLAETPAQKQTLLFSATLPARITALARQHLTNPVEVRLARQVVAVGVAPLVRQTGYVVPRASKVLALSRVLKVEGPAAALVFCRTRSEVDQLTVALAARNFRPEALHGGLSQDQRDRVMRLFRAGTANLLIATDVAARGLDIEHLSHVVNYDLPSTPEAYVHRIGRVGRAGREGVAITLAEPREQRLLRSIERTTGQKIETARVPTVADLRARRLEQTKESLRKELLEGNLDQFRGVVESLAVEFDVMAVALAAIKLTQQAEGPMDEEEIPVVAPPRERREPTEQGSRWREGNSRGRGPAAGMARLFIPAGRVDGIGHRDVVGAIANEAGVPGRDIAVVEIADRFSLVEVPEDVAEYVIDSMRGARLKGRKVAVRRDSKESGYRG